MQYSSRKKVIHDDRVLATNSLRRAEGIGILPKRIRKQATYKRVMLTTIESKDHEEKPHAKCLRIRKNGKSGNRSDPKNESKSKSGGYHPHPSLPPLRKTSLEKQQNLKSPRAGRGDASYTHNEANNMTEVSLRAQEVRSCLTQLTPFGEGKAKNARRGRGGALVSQTSYTNFPQFQNTSKPSFRQYLFIAICLAHFRTPQDILLDFAKQFRAEVSPQAIKRVERWMTRLDNEPELVLTKPQKRWRTIWNEYREARNNFLTNIRDIPLVHPKIRIQELVKLYDEVVPQPVRVLTWKTLRTDEDGNLVTSKRGKVLQDLHAQIVHEKDIPTAAALLKQIGVEAGTYIERSEHVVDFKDWIKQQRELRGLDKKADIQDAEIISSSVREEELDKIPLPAPVED